ncbi:unnamed protein product [Cylindrotheca closterium]|uniref:Uncharacterized protein n=1 Tax=Cylindrotheca closterium TaxID=2856 RepID=A0AAD2JIF6_9STRA|nr:unnamed protein product [Cylindrotheca closterium]CAJ1953840.1 unnamed protein product [Cylindrotheca closterium]
MAEVLEDPQPRNNDDNAGVDELDEAPVNHVVTPERIQYLGLKLVGYKRKRLQKSTARVNFERFKGFFGLSPVTAAEIYHDMQTTDIEEAKYPTERDMEARFGFSMYWPRNVAWESIERLRALKHKKIKWEEDLCTDDIWVLTVDGIHCWIQEPKHPV